MFFFFYKQMRNLLLQVPILKVNLKVNQEVVLEVSHVVADNQLLQVLAVRLNPSTVQTKVKYKKKQSKQNSNR